MLMLLGVKSQKDVVKIFIVYKIVQLELHFPFAKLVKFSR